MNSFTFHNTTKIIFGEGQIAKVTQEIPPGSKVLVLYGGGSIKKNGVYEQVQKALSGFSWDEFSGIEPNPQYDTLMKAVAKVKAEGFDYLLAVGGGSVVDGTKFIAAAVLYEGNDPWEILSEAAPVQKAMPLSCILTLPATGSESNGNSVVSQGNTKLPFNSPLVRPQFAILDPSTTLSLPVKYLANGVVDAFVHVIEQYLTYPVEAKVQDRFAEGLLSTLIEEGPKVLQGEDNMSARKNIMFAATMALNELIGAGVPQDWTTHMIGHELTGLYGIDHGRTLTIILPAVMRIRKQQKSAKLLQYATRVFGITTGSDEEKIDQAIAKTIAFFQTMGTPTAFADVELTSKDVEPVMASLKANGRLALGEHGDIDLAESRRILEAAVQHPQVESTTVAD